MAAAGITTSYKKKHNPTTTNYQQYFIDSNSNFLLVIFQNKNMHKILFWLFFAKIKMASCIPDANKSGFLKGKRIFEIARLGNMPSKINESSALLKVNNKNTFWTLNDGGGQTELYEIDTTGNVLATLPLPNTKNIDWEELASDNDGNIFIGDFGNNNNTRTNLKIYKIPINKPDSVQEITFKYADQRGYPPSKKQMNFDCEAFFWAKDSLYLFTKNRGKKYTKMYVIPSIAGNYTVEPKAEIYLKANITAADISPDKKQFVLLSYGKIYFFGIENSIISFSKPQFCVKAALKQSEAICYINPKELLITNEQGEIIKIKVKQ